MILKKFLFFFLLEFIILIVYQHLKLSLLREVDSSVKVLVYLMVTIFVAVIGISNIVNSDGYRHNPVKTVFTVFLLLMLPLPLSSLYWMILGNSMVSAAEYFSSMFAFSIIYLVLSLIIAVFIKPKKQTSVDPEILDQ